MPDTNIDKNTGTWRLVFVRLPSQVPFPAGVLLHDTVSDDLHIALVESVSDDPEIAGIWTATAEELRKWVAGGGGFTPLAHMEGYSHFLELGQTKHSIELGNPQTTLAALFDQHVLQTKVVRQTRAAK